MVIGLAAEYAFRYVLLPALSFIADVIANNLPIVLLVVGAIALGEYVGVPIISEWAWYYVDVWVINPAWTALVAGWDWFWNWIEGVIQDQISL